MFVVEIVDDQNMHYTEKLLPQKVKFRIGRGKGMLYPNDISLPSELPYVSREHCSLYADGEKCFLMDEGSSAGTLVNGTVAREMRQVSPKDDIVLPGNWRIVIRPWNGTEAVNETPLVPEQRLETVTRMAIVNSKRQLDDGPSPVSSLESKPAEEKEERNVELTPGQHLAAWKQETLPIWDGVPYADFLYSQQTMLLKRRLAAEVEAGLAARGVDMCKTLAPGDRECLEQMLDEFVKRNSQEFSEHVPVEVFRESFKEEILSLGPITTLLQNAEIRSVMINGADRILVEKEGGCYKTRLCFLDEKRLVGAVRRLVESCGGQFEASNPLVEAGRENGWALVAVMPPMALNGTAVTITKPLGKKMGIKESRGSGCRNEKVVSFLKKAVEQRRNILVSGENSPERMMLLSELVGFIPPDQRVVAIEGQEKLSLNRDNLVRLVASSAIAEGKLLTVRELVDKALRLRPARIVVGECQGGEALGMLKAMNAGYRGQLATLFANNCGDALRRFEIMALMAGKDMSVAAVHELSMTNINLVVHVSQSSGTERGMVTIMEIVELEDGTMALKKVDLEG